MGETTQCRIMQASLIPVAVAGLINDVPVKWPTWHCVKSVH